LNEKTASDYFGRGLLRFGAALTEIEGIGTMTAPEIGE
jgi:hypothetical protein